MPKIRLFCTESLEEKKEIDIDGDNFHYLVNVMRCEVGSIVFLFNQNDGEFQSKVSDKRKKSITLTINSRKEYEGINNNFSLIFCPPKSSRLDILIQKCTEIGVNNFIPIISDRTENRKLNINRIEKIIKEAVEQSNQIHVPGICESVSFSKFVENYNKNNNDLFFADIQSNFKFSNLKIDNTKSNFILIGPEGDFSPLERESILQNRAVKPFTLSRNILRSDTAVISAISLVNFINNSH